MIPIRSFILFALHAAACDTASEIHEMQSRVLADDLKIISLHFKIILYDGMATYIGGAHDT